MTMISFTIDFTDSIAFAMKFSSLLAIIHKAIDTIIYGISEGFK